MRGAGSFPAAPGSSRRRATRNDWVIPRVSHCAPAARRFLGMRGAAPQTPRDIFKQKKGSDLGGLMLQGLFKIAVAGEAVLEVKAKPFRAGARLVDKGRIMGLGLIDQFGVIAEQHIT